MKLNKFTHDVKSSIITAGLLYLPTCLLYLRGSFRLWNVLKTEQAISSHIHKQNVFTAHTIRCIVMYIK